MIVKLVFTNPGRLKDHRAYLIYQVPQNSPEFKMLLKGVRGMGGRLVEMHEPKPKRKKAVKK